MTARTRIALLAVLASLGLVAVAYGAGTMVGGGSSAAAPGAQGSQQSSPPAAMFDTANQPGTRPHRHPCPHDRGNGGSSSGSSDNGTGTDTAPTGDAQAY